MGKGPGLYTDIGKKARDLLYRDYQSDQKFTITTYTSAGVAITSSGTKKGELFLADVNTQLKNKNITTDIKVDTNSNVSHINSSQAIVFPFFFLKYISWSCMVLYFRTETLVIALLCVTL